MVDDSITRQIVVNLGGTDGGEDESLEVDDDEPDLIGWVCEECGHRESSEHRKNDDVEEDDEDDEDEG